MLEYFILIKQKYRPILKSINLKMQLKIILQLKKELREIIKLYTKLNLIEEFDIDNWESQNNLLKI